MRSPADDIPCPEGSCSCCDQHRETYLALIEAEEKIGLLEEKLAYEEDPE